MSHQYRCHDNVNIDHYPQFDNDYSLIEGQQVTLGDLHGNFQKLLYTAVRHGAIDVSEQDFNKLTRLYQRKSLNKKQIALFNKILSRIHVKPTSEKSLLRLLGDILTDRGQNDYFTLKLLQKFKRGGLPFEILLSNHDAEFIRIIETNASFYDTHLGKGQGKSSSNLQAMIDKELITRQEIEELYEDSYKPNLKALSYSFDESLNKMTIYSHGLIGLNNIRYMAEAAGVPYISDQPADIAKAIDGINAKVAEHIKNNTFYEFSQKADVPTAAINGEIPIDEEQFPFVHLMWNRNPEGLNRPDYISFVHGHDMYDETRDNIINLDNLLGKAPGEYHIGQYNFLYSNEQSYINSYEFSEFQFSENDSDIQTEDECLTTGLIQDNISANQTDDEWIASIFTHDDVKHENDFLQELQQFLTMPTPACDAIQVPEFDEIENQFEDLTEKSVTRKKRDHTEIIGETFEPESKRTSPASKASLKIRIRLKSVQ